MLDDGTWQGGFVGSEYVKKAVTCYGASSRQSSSFLSYDENNDEERNECSTQTDTNLTVDQSNRKSNDKELVGPVETLAVKI